MWTWSRELPDDAGLDMTTLTGPAPPDDGGDDLLAFDRGEVEDVVRELEVGDVRAESVPVVEMDRPEAEAVDGYREVLYLREGVHHEGGVGPDAGADGAPAFADRRHLSPDRGLDGEVLGVPPGPMIRPAGAR